MVCVDPSRCFDYTDCIHSCHLPGAEERKEVYYQKHAMEIKELEAKARREQEEYQRSVALALQRELIRKQQKDQYEKEWLREGF